MIEKHIPKYTVIGYNPYLTVYSLFFALGRSCKRRRFNSHRPGLRQIFLSKIDSIGYHIPQLCAGSLDEALLFLAQKIHYAAELRLLIRLALQKAHIITAVSHFTANMVKQDLRISRPVRVIYNGVDVDQFKPAASSPYLPEGSSCFFFGKPHSPKRCTLAPLNCTSSLGKNIRIYYTQGLRTQNDLASDAKLQPIGSVPFKDMANRYRQMDLLVMPSVREGFGLAVAEAMSCGLPVVASNCSAIPELIDDGKGGFLCPVGDVNAFAEKINLSGGFTKVKARNGRIQSRKS